MADLSLGRELLNRNAQQTVTPLDIGAQSQQEMAFANALAATQGARQVGGNALQQAAAAQRNQLTNVFLSAKGQEKNAAESEIRMQEAELKRIQEAKAAAEAEARKRRSFGILGGLLSAAGYVVGNIVLPGAGGYIGGAIGGAMGQKE